MVSDPAEIDEEIHALCDALVAFERRSPAHATRVNARATLCSCAENRQVCQKMLDPPLEAQPQFLRD
jgi:hypothetical protein